VPEALPSALLPPVRPPRSRRTSRVPPSSVRTTAGAGQEDAARDCLPLPRLPVVPERKLREQRRLTANNLDRRVPTAKLNQVVRDAVLAHPPPIHSDKALKVLYCSQPQTHPPLFVFHCNDPDLIQSHYKRFLENTIRQNFDFEGVPLTLEFRSRREGGNEQPPPH